MIQEKKLITCVLFLVITGGLLLFTSGCKDISDEELYQRPPWLVGKLYTQMAARPELSIFIQAISRTPYREIFDRSGYFTVFAPTNAAFELYFSTNSLYKSLSDMPDSAVVKLVEYAIIRNGWTQNQLRSLNQIGWLDPEDPLNNLPTAYKRETVYEDTTWKYLWNNDLAINPGWYHVIPDYPKLAPIFFQEFMKIYNYSSQDYEYFFHRPFEGGQSLYFAGALVLEAEIPAENGFIYTVDRVTEPLPNLGNILRDNPEYSEFYNLINEFSYLTYNKEKTELQEGTSEGLVVDKLYQIDYPDLTFNVFEEKPRLLGIGGSNVYYLTTNYSLFAPTNKAFNKLIEDYVTAPGHYPTLAAAPFTVKQIIADSHLGIQTIFPSDFKVGVINGQADTLQVGLESVDKCIYCSNGQLYSFTKAIVPRAFSSITGPVFLRPEFSDFMAAMTTSKVLPTLKSPTGRFTFLPVNNFITAFDSTLFVEEFREGSSISFSYTRFDRGVKRMTSIPGDEIRRMVMNQVGLEEYQGFSNLEFIETLSGNYLRIFKHTNGDLIVAGGIPTTGYQTDTTRGVVDIKMIPIQEQTDNGKTYDMIGKVYDSFLNKLFETTTGGWIYPANISLYGLLSQSNYLMELLFRTGLADLHWRILNFQKGSERFTIFAPSDAAFSVWAFKKYGFHDSPTPKAFADSLLNYISAGELKRILSYHMVRGHMIFTDGKKPSGMYETLALSDGSTQYNVVYEKLDLTFMPDYIGIRNQAGTLLAELNFPDISIDPNRPTWSIFRSNYNKMASKTIDISKISPYNYTTVATVHIIDQVLVPE